MSPHATIKGKLDNNFFHFKERMNLCVAEYLFGFALGEECHIWDISVLLGLERWNGHWNTQNGWHQINVFINCSSWTEIFTTGLRVLLVFSAKIPRVTQQVTLCQIQNLAERVKWKAFVPCRLTKQQEHQKKFQKCFCRDVFCSHHQLKRFTAYVEHRSVILSKEFCCFAIV